MSTTKDERKGKGREGIGRERGRPGVGEGEVQVNGIPGLVNLMNKGATNGATMLYAVECFKFFLFFLFHVCDGS